MAAARTAIERFMREMEVIEQLKHPHVVEFLEQGSARGQLWFAMEHVAGTNLEALANSYKGKFPIPQACRMACQVLRGLEQPTTWGSSTATSSPRTS
jgi:serine/threonine-protein kinase